MRIAFLTVVLAVLTIAALPASITVRAGPGPAVRIASGTDTVGQDAVVALQALDIASPGLGGWTVDVTYDAGVLSPVTCLGQNGSVCNPNFGPDTVRVTGASAGGLVGDTNLAQLRFHCDSGGTSALTVVLQLFVDATPGTPQPIAATIINGSVICRPDADLDGCADEQELGSDPTLGGLRDPSSFWDFYDVPTGLGLQRDQSVSGSDIFAVIGRFNATGDAGIDPLSPPPASGYHTAYDRGLLVGPDPWDLGAADGSIASTDIFGVIGQFNHSCA